MKRKGFTLIELLVVIAIILKNAVAPCFGAFLASNLSRILCL